MRKNRRHVGFLSVFRQVVFAALCLITALANNAQAQLPDSIQGALSYYPLEDGDRWQYNNTSPAYNGSDFGIYPYREVLGDSTLANGFTYKKVKWGDRSPYGIRFERIDTSNAVVYHYLPEEADIIGFENGEVPFLLLPTSVNVRTMTEGAWSLSCRSDPDEVILGSTMKLWVCHQYRYGDSEIRTLGVGFGLVQWWFFIADHFWVWDVIHVRTSHSEVGVVVSTEEYHQSDGAPAQVYPNPITPGQRLIIKGDAINEYSFLAVFDVQGKMVSSYSRLESVGSTIMIPTEFMAPGTYFLVLQSSRNTETLPFVVLSR